MIKEEVLSLQLNCISCQFDVVNFERKHNSKPLTTSLQGLSCILPNKLIHAFNSFLLHANFKFKQLALINNYIKSNKTIIQIKEQTAVIYKNFNKGMLGASS